MLASVRHNFWMLAAFFMPRPSSALKNRGGMGKEEKRIFIEGKPRKTNGGKSVRSPVSLLLQ